MDSLSPELFWDVKREEVSPSKHLRWLTERILVYGRWRDWCLLIANTPVAELKNVSPRLKVPARAKVFLENYVESALDA